MSKIVVVSKYELTPDQLTDIQETCGEEEIVLRRSSFTSVTDIQNLIFGYDRAILVLPPELEVLTGYKYASLYGSI